MIRFLSGMLCGIYIGQKYNFKPILNKIERFLEENKNYQSNKKE